MTEEEKSIIISMFSLGYACGLLHPIECFVNYLGSLQHTEYSKIPILEKVATSAIVKYLRKCSCHPDDPLEKLTEENLGDYIDKFYKSPKSF